MQALQHSEALQPFNNGLLTPVGRIWQCLGQMPGSTPSLASKPPPPHNCLHVPLGFAHNVPPHVCRQAHLLGQQAALHSPRVEEQAAAGERGPRAPGQAAELKPGDEPMPRAFGRQVSLLNSPALPSDLGSWQQGHRLGNCPCLSGTKLLSASTRPASCPLPLPTAREMGVSITVIPCFCSSFRSCGEEVVQRMISGWECDWAARIAPAFKARADGTAGGTAGRRGPLPWPAAHGNPFHQLVH